MPKLTKSIIDKAEIKEKQYTLWDSDLSGFGVYVNPTGKFTYFVDYRSSEGRRRRMTIGRHGAITTEQARKLAIETMGGVVLQKDDPLEERRNRRKSITVSELCDKYLAAAKKGLIIGKGGRPKKQSTLDTDGGRIERHIKPLLGTKLVIDLKASDISRFIRDVTVGKTAKVEKTKKLRGKAVVEGGAGTASRTTGLLGGILSYAVSDGIITSNPVHGVKRPADNKKERRLFADEYKALGAVLADSAEPWQAVEGFRLLCLTGCRLSEITQLRWSEVDIDGSALRLGDSKTRKSIRPIGKPAIEALERIPVEDRGEYVLQGIRDAEKAYGGLSAAIERITAAAKLTGVTAHVLRHSFASVAADLDYSDNTIGAIIGHSGTTITSRYTHRLDTVLIAAANKISAEINRQMK